MPPGSPAAGRESAEKVLVTCWQQLLAGTAAASLQVVGFAGNILGNLSLEEPVVELSVGTFQVVKLAGKGQKILQIEGFAAVGI